MKRNTRFTLTTLVLVLAVLLSMSGSAGAAPAGRMLLQGGAPTVVSYQGQVTVDGIAYTGTGYFKFAVVNTAGDTTYWSNNGSSTIGDEPTTAVTLTVTNGLFNVLLGDTTLTNMIALPAAAFSDPDRALRVWFSSDGNTFTLLSPDRRIAAVPYALQAEEAKNADTLDGQHASAFVYTAGTGLNLAANQFSISTSTVQARVSGVCEVGSTVRAVNADGTVICEAHDNAPVFSRTTLDGGSDSGRYSSIALGADGLGLVAYADWSANGLKVAHCNDAACTDATLSTIDAVDLWWISVAIGADGLGLISYQNRNGTLKVAHCTNVACTSATSTTVDANGDVGGYNAIAIGADGLGLISYQDYSNQNLKVAHCSDMACTTATLTTLDNSAGDVGGYTSVTIGVDGLGLISYYDSTDSNLKVAHCSNITCTTATLTSLDTADVGDNTSVTIGVDGLGLISYYDWGNYHLKVAHCTNLACTTAMLTTLDSAGRVGTYSAVTIGADRLGLISYYDATNGNLKVAHCSNLACTAATYITVDDSANNVGQYTSVMIGMDGWPLISYYDATNRNLKVAHCSNAFCTPYFRRR